MRAHTHGHDQMKWVEDGDDSAVHACRRLSAHVRPCQSDPSSREQPLSGHLQWDNDEEQLLLLVAEHVIDEGPARTNQQHGYKHQSTSRAAADTTGQSRVGRHPADVNTEPNHTSRADKIMLGERRGRPMS